MVIEAEKLIAGRVDALPDGLRRHTYRVRGIALELARQHGVDEARACLGALAHDVARAMKGDELLRKAQELGIPVHPVEGQVPLLLHGPVGAELLRRAGGLDDPDIYEAVYWHSTARRGMGPLAKVVFLADKLDPQKAGRYPFLPELGELARTSLNGAILDFLSREMTSLVQHGSLVHPASLEARNDLLMGPR